MWCTEDWRYATHGDTGRLEKLLETIRCSGDLAVVVDHDADRFIIIGPSSCAVSRTEAEIVARALNRAASKHITD